MSQYSRHIGWPVFLTLVTFLGLTIGTASAQIITTVPTAAPNSTPTQTATGPDGTIWFVEETGNRIGTISPSRTAVSEVNLVIPGSRPTAITVARSGLAWFAESGTNKIASYNRSTNSLVEYQLPGGSLGLAGISVDARGKVWFTEKLTNRVGVLDPSRLSVKYVSWTNTNVGLQSIATDSLGRGWFTQNTSNQIGVLDLSPPTPTVSSYSGPLSGPYGISIAANNNVWFTEQSGGYVSALNPTTGTVFQFDTWGGAGSQPRYIDTWQSGTGQSFVSWTEGALGRGRIGLLNPRTGGRSQILTSPYASPAGISYGRDNSLWWTESASSQITGSFFNSSIVWRAPHLGEPLLTLFDLPSTRFAGTRGEAWVPGSGNQDRVELAGGTGTRDGYHLRMVSLEQKAATVRVLPVFATLSHLDRSGSRMSGRRAFGVRNSARIRLAELADEPSNDSPKPIPSDDPSGGSLKPPPPEDPVGGTPKQVPVDEWSAILDVITVTSTPSNPTAIVRLLPTNADMYVSAIGSSPNTGSRDQVTVHLGDCVTLKYLVKFRTGAFIDVTEDPNTRFFLDPPRGVFTAKNVWCPTAADVDKSLTIYGRHYSPTGEQAITDTVKVLVRR
jgi:virginiamycin B lyase